LKARLVVAVPHPLLAERAVDSASDSVPNPDDDAEQKDGENKLQSGYHESLRDFCLIAID